MAPPRKTIALALVVALAACGDIFAPSRWEEVCASGETGPRYYGRPPAGPLAMPQENDPQIGLLLIGASSVEIFGHPSPDRPERAALYHQGSGRYLVSLAEPRTAACNEALINNGYDTETLAFNPDSSDAMFTYDLAPCFTAEHLGAVPPRPEEHEHFTSRYIARVEGTRDPRSDEDHPIGRGAYQIFDRETNQVIAENIMFSSNAGHYYIECPRVSRRWLHAFPWDVFERE